MSKIKLGLLLFTLTLVPSEQALCELPLSTAFAAANDIECTVAEVLDNGDFENISDFSFADYPHATYEAETTTGQSFHVGGFWFDDSDSTITVTKAGNITVVTAVPVDSLQVFKLTVTSSTGLFEYTEGGTTTQVARLTCE